jgi:hypothetical protein
MRYKETYQVDGCKVLIVRHELSPDLEAICVANTAHSEEVRTKAKCGPKEERSSVALY